MVKPLRPPPPPIISRGNAWGREWKLFEIHEFGRISRFHFILQSGTLAPLLSWIDEIFGIRVVFVRRLTIEVILMQFVFMLAKRKKGRPLRRKGRYPKVGTYVRGICAPAEAVVEGSRSWRHLAVDWTWISIGIRKDSLKSLSRLGSSI